jgi:CO/xanthine dehydrogenase FAD-binding subunit
MYSAPFEYLRASSWEDAVAQLERGDEDAHVLAGGQSLVPMMMLGLAAPTLLVDVGGAGERTIELRDGSLVLSALVRHVDLEQSEVVRDACPMLREAVRHIGNVRVRHRGTIGGSLAHAEATAELTAVAVAHRATARVLGPRGERTVPAADLFVTHLTTSLEPGEVITGVEFPVATGPRTGSCFLEMARRAGDFAMAEVAATVSLDEAGRCEEVRLVVGAVADRPADCTEAAHALIGAPPGQAVVAELAHAVADQVEIGPSSHASVEYRREMVAVLVERAMRTAVARGSGLDADAATNGRVP